MEEFIEKYKLEKAQIVGQIMQLDEHSRRIGDSFTVSQIDLLEALADVYDAMIEMAEAFIKLKKGLKTK